MIQEMKTNCCAETHYTPVGAKPAASPQTDVEYDDAARVCLPNELSDRLHEHHAGGVEWQHARANDDVTDSHEPTGQ